MTQRASQAPSFDLGKFVGYLNVLARTAVRPEQRGKLDPSDIVQQTLLEAHRSRALFRGGTDGELAAWLREILTRNIADALRALHRKKRDIARERSLDRAVEESSRRLEAWLIKDETSPSERAAREERVLRLAEVLASLPEEEQEAALCRFCRGMTLEETAKRLGVSRYAVARRLARAVRSLRDGLKGFE
jgi:RNA polymerase sigma-70 factor (ECF subfamily)